MSLLAEYAVTEKISRKRKYPQAPHAYRSDFERDRDRVIHCSAFRRLEGKTQVFTVGVNDHYRTRLTHTIEVSQIGRTIARVLNVNQELTEAICLAHDLGHSPFGHTGEAVLNLIMKNFGGFEHNRQSLRIVDLLEHPYPDFQGINLMYETRLGLAKHKSTYDQPDTQTSEFTEPNCSIEGQIADLADRIAYNCHDLEDGMRSRIIPDKTIGQIPLCQQAIEAISADKIDDVFVRMNRISKTILDILISDLIGTSKEQITENNIARLNDVLNRKENIIRLSNNADQLLSQLEKFLYDNLYMHDDVKKAADRTKVSLTKLFDFFMNQPNKMPRYYQSFTQHQPLQRSVCDYIAGMTDRYCMQLIEENKL